MSRSYVQFWDWFNDFEYRARRVRDMERIRIVELYNQAWEIRQKNPDHALSLYQQGAKLAQELDEPCMELFHEYRASELLIFYKHNIRDGLDYAIKLVTKASLPRYVQCLVRGRVYITLISAYFMYDASGYRKEIEDMIDFMEREIAMDEDTHQRLQSHRVLLEMDQNNYQKAESEALEYLAMCEGDTYREADSYRLLTDIAYRLGKNEATLEYAVMREEKARKINDYAGVAVSLIWQALIARKQGDEIRAHSLYTQGVVQRANLGMTKNREYYNILGYFYQAGNDSEKLLALREEQIETIKNLGDADWLFNAHYERCVLLKRMNRLTPADIEAAREVVKGLKQQEPYLKKLDSL